MRSVETVPEKRLELVPDSDPASGQVGRRGKPLGPYLESRAGHDGTTATNGQMAVCKQLWQHYKATDPAAAAQLKGPERLARCTQIRVVDMQCLLDAKTPAEIQDCRKPAAPDLCKLAFANSRAIDALSIKRPLEDFIRGCSSGSLGLTEAWTMCVIDAGSRSALEYCDALVIP